MAMAATSERNINKQHEMMYDKYIYSTSTSLAITQKHGSAWKTAMILQCLAAFAGLGTLAILLVTQYVSRLVFNLLLAMIASITFAVTYTIERLKSNCKSMETSIITGLKLVVTWIMNLMFILLIILWAGLVARSGFYLLQNTMGGEMLFKTGAFAILILLNTVIGYFYIFSKRYPNLKLPLLRISLIISSVFTITLAFHTSEADPFYPYTIFLGCVFLILLATSMFEGQARCLKYAIGKRKDVRLVMYSIILFLMFCCIFGNACYYFEGYSSQLFTFIKLPIDRPEKAFYHIGYGSTYWMALGVFCFIILIVNLLVKYDSICTKPEEDESVSSFVFKYSLDVICFYFVVGYVLAKLGFDNAYTMPLYIAFYILCNIALFLCLAVNTMGPASIIVLSTLLVSTALVYLNRGLLKDLFDYLLTYFLGTVQDLE